MLARVAPQFARRRGQDGTTGHRRREAASPRRGQSCTRRDRRRLLSPGAACEVAAWKASRNAAMARRLLLSLGRACGLVVNIDPHARKSEPCRRRGIAGGRAACPPLRRPWRPSNEKEAHPLLPVLHRGSAGARRGVRKWGERQAAAASRRRTAGHHVLEHGAVRKRNTKSRMRTTRTSGSERSAGHNPVFT
jgi:hypothetical protein